MFQFNYTITEDDYLKFNLNHTLHSKFGKRTALLCRLAVPFVFAFFTFIAWFGEPISPSLLKDIIFFSVLSILWNIFFEKYALYKNKKLMRKMKKVGRLPYNESGTLIFDENFIYDKGIFEQSMVSYNIIEAIYTTNEAVYIYNSAASAIILPYRFIENQAVFNSFMDFLQAKTNKTIINITK